MKWLTWMKYLPVVLSTVQAVEGSIGAHSGSTKLAVTMGAIQAGAKAVGDTLPEEHVQTIAGMVEAAVGVFNSTGVFTHK